MLKLFFRTFTIRLIMVAVWIGLIIGALAFFRWGYFSRSENSITLFTWGGLIDPTYIKAFERETGIKVTMSYYSTNEELLVTLGATKGKGYDIIVPSDYAVDLLRKQNILKKIDRSQLNFWHTLDTRLLNQDFDPHNDYSIPYSWEIFGFGVDTEFFARQDKKISFTWKTAFCPPFPFKITMVNDPIEAVLFAHHYLFAAQPVKIPVDAEQREKIKNVLLCQKKWVEAYTDFRADYFLITRNCPLVIASSSYILRSMRDYSFIEFVVPQDGSFITIENIALPASSSKEKLVYKFLNFLYMQASFKHHYKLYAFLPALDPEHSQKLDLDERARQLLDQTAQDFTKFSFFRPIMKEADLQGLWVAVKSESGS